MHSFSSFFASIADWLSSFHFLRTPDEVNAKIHDYTKLNQGTDYVFEPIGEGRKGYLTGQDKTLKCGDYLILTNDSGSSRYQVESIEHYSNAPDMWIALVNKVSDD